jgi:hypothetical protein
VLAEEEKECKWLKVMDFSFSPSLHGGIISAHYISAVL